MNHLLRTVVGLTVGAICGAILAAVMLGVPTYLDESCGFLGCSRDLTPLAVYMGIICGSGPGAVIGLIVGLGSFNRRKSMGMGALTGLVVAIILFGMGVSFDELVGVVAILSIPGGALVGLIVRECLGLGGIFRKVEYEKK